MTKKCKCKCPKKVDFTIMLPEGIEMGDLEVYQVASDGKAVNEFRPSRVDSDWDSDSEDPDYIAGIDSDDDPYENLPFTEKEKQELRDELASLIIEQMENDESQD